MFQSFDRQPLIVPAGLALQAADIELGSLADTRTDLAGFSVIITDRPIYVGGQGPFGLYLAVGERRLFIQRESAPRDFDAAIRAAFDCGVAVGRLDAAGELDDGGSDG